MNNSSPVFGVSNSSSSSEFSQSAQVAIKELVQVSPFAARIFERQVIETTMLLMLMLMIMMRKRRRKKVKNVGGENLMTRMAS